MRPLASLLLLLVACAPPATSDAGTPDAGPGPVPDAGRSYPVLEVDVVVRENQVVVHPRERDRLCQCARGDFPPEGFCAPESDARRCSCAPEDESAEVDGPARCLQGLELLAGGAVVGAVGWNPASGRVGVAHDDGTLIADLAEPALRLVGCGEVAEIPLPVAAPPAPTFVEFTSTDGRARLHWTSADAGDTAFLCGGNGLSGMCCRSAWEAEGSLPLPANDERALWAMFSQLRGGDVTQTALGDVRVWHAGGFNVVPAFGPEPLADGRYRLGTSFPSYLFVTAAGAVALDNQPLLVEEITADLALADPADSLFLRARGQPGATEIVVEYALGGGELAVRVVEQGSAWEATVSFVEPTGELALGDDVPRTVLLDSGLLTAVNVADDEDTLTLTVSGRLDFPPLATPQD